MVIACVFLWQIREVCCTNDLSHWSQANGFSPVWMRSCAMTWAFWTNRFSQYLHWNGFSPVCTRKWVAISSFLEKRLPHSLQLKGFSPVWVRLCRTRLFLEANICSQLLHLNGFSPMCILMWLIRLFRWAKHLSQCSQAYGFSPVWIRSCITTEVFRINACSQYPHLNGFSPVCTRICSFSSLWYRKDLPHIVQLRDFLVLLLAFILFFLFSENLSLPCFLLCMISPLSCLKLLPHCWQVKRFSPVWILLFSLVMQLLWEWTAIWWVSSNSIESKDWWHLVQQQSTNNLLSLSVTAFETSPLENISCFISWVVDLSVTRCCWYLKCEYVRYEPWVNIFKCEW